MLRRWLIVAASLLAVTGCHLRAAEANPAHPVPAGDALTRYKAYVHQVVEAYWYSQIAKTHDVFPVGEVLVRYTIHADGTVTDVTVLTDEEEGLTKLKKMSVESIQKSAPYKPFDAALIKQIGNKFCDKATFTLRGPY